MIRFRTAIAFWALTTASLSARSDGAGEQWRSPAERNGFVRLTAADTIESYVRSLDASPRIAVSLLARTAEGRPVIMARVTAPPDPGASSPKLKVLLFAQQHGDEPSGKEALLLFLSRAAAGEYDALLEQLDLIVIPQMNPDGAERRQRRTADGLDMNRSHLLLNIPQVAALHELFGKEEPEVTLDVHEYGSFSRSWSDHGIMKRGDVQIGTLTNLNSDARLRRYEREHVLPFIRGTVERNGFSCNEYIVGDPGSRVRHSTTEINDGRQSFGILQTLSFIQEGRKWRTLEEQLERRTRSQCAGVEALCFYAAAHAAEIRKLVREARGGYRGYPGRLFYGIMEHGETTPAPEIPVTTIPGLVDTLWRITPYHGEVVPLDSSRVPAAYVVQKEATEVQGLLEKHHIKTERITTSEERVAEEPVLYPLRLMFIEEESLFVPVVRWRAGTIVLRDGDLIVPTAQPAGLLAATILEPASAWGLLKYPAFQSLPGMRPYPILRLPVRVPTIRRSAPRATTPRMP